ncbi:lipid kinase [Mesorhizobium sp. WSM3860]|uniref:lipid kinase n=1 Tax=Mesorhizobium sp. WSM3860 TaxID=2029403 RepID=UPI000BAEB808|nr:lipid kinase [Mesorhizobium sp. WSM3860]PBC01659.1 lipid kinase [Mesorhizobium sp. WSM3860]
MSKLAEGRALLLVNPNARRGQEQIAPIVERLERSRLSVTVEKFEALPEIARDIVRLRHMADLVVVCGGDGSVSSAAMATMESGLPMGIIPMGTANDLARTLNIPMDLLQAADVIARGRTRRIDVGTVNGHAFFNVASIGLSTELAQGLDPVLKKRFGRLGYALAAMKVLTRAVRFHAKITEKGAAIEVETYQIAVGNGRHYGGGNVVEETAEIDDGHLDLYSLEMTNLWKLALMIRSFRSGTHGAWREVRTARCVEFDIETRKPMPVNTDGEIVTSTPAHFKVHPKAISVFAPPSVGSPGRTEMFRRATSADLELSALRR